MNACWMDVGSTLGESARKWALSGRSGLRFVDIGMAELRVREVGPAGAPAFVFAVDSPVSIEHYDRLLASWPSDRRAVVLEMPAFGFSRARRGFDFTVASFAEATVRAMDALECRKPALVFPCAWGFVALEVARTHPERVSRLVLPQVPSWEDMARWADRVDRSRVLRRPVVGQLLMKARSGFVARQWFSYAYPDRQFSDGLHATCAEAFAHGGKFPLGSLMQGYERSRAPVAGPLDVPVQVLWGGGDRSHRRTPPESFRSLVPGAGVEVLAAAGHSPELEHPDRLLAILGS